jgi:hypothetical protein
VLAAHLGQCHTNQLQRAEKIGAHLFCFFVMIELFHDGAITDAGIVDEDINAAVVRENSIHKIFTALWIGKLKDAVIDAWTMNEFFLAQAWIALVRLRQCDNDP